MKMDLLSFFSDPLKLIILGGFLSAIGGVIALYGTYKEAVRSSKQADIIIENVDKTKGGVIVANSKLDEVTAQLISATEKIKDQETIIDRLRSENIEVSDKLVKASGQIYKFVTGGDSYCKLDVGFIEKFGIYYQLVHVGSEQLSAVRVSIVDNARRAYLRSQIKSDQVRLARSQEIGRETKYDLTITGLVPGDVRKIDEVKFESGQANIDLSVEIILPNGRKLTQVIRCEKCLSYMTRRVVSELKEGDIVIEKY